MTTLVWENRELEVIRLWGGVGAGICYQFTPRGEYARLSEADVQSLIASIAKVQGLETAK